LIHRLTADMEQAALDQKYERAAVVRDRIQALNTVRERQKIISTEPEDQDLVGLARQGSEACVQVFFVRRGRLLGRESFFLDRLTGVPDGDVLSAFLRQFYAKNVQPPREVLLSTEVPEVELTAEWLAQRRNGRVELLVPQRGRKRELVAMAEE